MADVVYGRQAVREALRGRREVGVVWCAPGLGETLDWLPRDARTADPQGLAQRAGTPDHQGVVAEVSAFRYAEPAALFRGENALVVALDEVTDPHNLGAVARVAECAGAHGLVITGRRSAAVTAAACRASAGAVEHLPIAQVENLADLLLRDAPPGPLELRGRGRLGDARTIAPTIATAAVFVLGAEGRGMRRRVRKVCDQRSRSRCAAGSSR